MKNYNGLNSTIGRIIKMQLSVQINMLSEST